MSTLRSPSASCQTSSSPLVDSSSITGPPLSVNGSSPLRLRTRSFRPVRRRKRTMTPVYKKDSTYWDKRRKNNEAARRSRERRRLNDLMMEGQLLALNEENAQLRAHLSLQYHNSASAGTSKASSPVGATLTSSVVAPTLSLSPINPGYSRAGHWVNSGDATASILNVRHHENRPCETDISCFGTTEADGAFKGATTFLQGLRSAEAEMGPQRHIAFSDDNFTQNYYIQAFLHAPADTPLHASANKPLSWLESHLSSSAVYNNLLLPWWSSYTPPPTTIYSCLPPYRLSCAGPGLHLRADGR